MSAFEAGQIQALMNSAPNANTKAGQAEGCRRVLAVVREGLGSKAFDADDFSYHRLAIEMGVYDPMRESAQEAFQRMASHSRTSENVRMESLLHESNPGLNSNAFQIVTAELIGSKMIEGYEMDYGYIGDELVDVMKNQKVRNQKIAGFTALAGPSEVKEGHPYEESGFEDKYVTTSESKKGRLLSINEELLIFDQTGEINRRARLLGEAARQEREETILNGIMDVNSNVYRPNGTAEALYASDGSNYNWIGSGNTTSSSYNSATALEDWTDVDHVLKYRATEIKDDRVDGTPQPIGGLNSKRNILLVPEALGATAWYIANAIDSETTTNTTYLGRARGNPVQGKINKVLTSPLLDNNGAQGVNDWYYGDFKRQFLWTEIMPLGVFTQGRDSESAFERDVVLRVKVRYYAGISAIDSKWVTKVDGA